MSTVRRERGAFARLEVALKELDNLETRVGFFPSAKYEKGEDENGENGTPVAYIAAIQELGYEAGGIPARPFMRPTAIRQRAFWASVMERGARAVLKGNVTATEVMDQLGARAAADIAATISSIWTPPLKQDTIKARLRKKANRKILGSLDKPLVDTGKMLESVTHETSKE